MASLPIFLDRVHAAENEHLEQQNIRRVIVLGNGDFPPMATVGKTGPEAREEVERIE